MKPKRTCEGPGDPVTGQASEANGHEVGTVFAERGWMGVGRVARSLAGIVCVAALVHCGGDDSSGGPSDQDANPPASDAASNAAEGGSGEAAADVSAPDSTIAPGFDAGDAGAGDTGTNVQDATADAGRDSTVGPQGDADVGPDAADATVTPMADGGNAGDGADGGDVQDANMDAADAPDTALPPLVCGTQTCARTEFCGTLGPDAGVEETADAGDAAGDAAIEGGANDGGSAVLACTSAVFGNICDNATATLFLDSYSVDNEAANTIGASLATACGMTVESPDAAPFDPVTEQPLTGIGNLCVVGGGKYGQKVIDYLDEHSLTDVGIGGGYDGNGVFDINFTNYSNPAAPVVLVSAPYSPTPTNTDYFLVELATDPVSGSLCLDVQGMSAQGTAAGAYYVANHLLGNGAFRSNTNSWLIYYWASADDGGVLSDADTFTLAAFGP